MGAGFGFAFMDGFSVNTKRDPGNCHFEALRSGISDGENFKRNSNFVVGNDGNFHHTDTRPL